MRMRISYRRFRRYRQIINILVRNGFEGLLESLKLRRIHRKRRPPVEAPPSPRAKRLRLALEELGPTFIKMGQMLTTRPEIVPVDILDELQKLQDSVPPAKTEEIISEIETELKSPVHSIFSNFDETPIAAASIGQVHRAELETGEQVVVKVQRPNIRRIIEDDIDILRSLAGLAERHIPEADIYAPSGIVNEFARVIRQELDYTQEARNMDKFALNFAEDDTVYIPRVYWNLTSGRVLTMERIDGIKINDVEQLREAGFDTKSIARKGAEAYLKQIFVDRFFHGDPHPGNICVLPGEVIGFMDFGMVGRLSPKMASQLNSLIIAIVRKDAGSITDGLLQLSVVDEEADIEELRTDMAELVDRYYGVPLKQFQIAEMLREMSEISARYRIRVNRHLNLLGKVLAGIEGMGRHLDPDFNVIPLIEPFAKRLVAQKISPRELFGKTGQIVKDYADLMTALPRDLRTALEKAKSGKLRMELKHIGLENIVPELERSTSRMAFAMIIAALVVGSALIMQVKPSIGPSFFGISIIGSLGYFIAAICGLWLLITIIRNKSLK